MKEFSIENIRSVIRYFKDDELIIGLIEDTVNSCFMYFEHMSKHKLAVEIGMISPSKENSKLIDRTEDRRTVSYRSMISSFNDLNRLLKEEGLEEFYNSIYPPDKFAIKVTEEVSSIDGFDFGDIPCIA